MAEAKEQAEQLRKDYKEVFESESGRRVLEDLKKICYFYGTTIHVHPHIMANYEGQRNVVLHILTKLKLNVEKLKELQNARQG